MKRLTFAVALLGVALSSRAARADGTTNSTLYEGDYLFQGQRVVADSGYYHLEMQTDGNLVLYAGAGSGDVKWATGTNQYCYTAWPETYCSTYAARYATLQTDGNFVVYFDQGWAGWSSNTAGGQDYASAQVWLQQDGNLVGYRWSDASRAVSWASNTAGAVLGQNGLQSSITHVVTDSNLAGDDYRSELTNDMIQCGEWCAGNAGAPSGSACNAFTWVPPGVQGASGVCWLKTGIPAASYDAGLVSGTIRH